VDGRSLAELLGATQRDLVGRLDRDHANRNAQSLRVLTGSAQPDFGNDRVMLLVCPECGDLGCGAITAALHLEGDTITWSEFRHENNYAASMTTRFKNVGPFTFIARAYRAALTATLSQSDAGSSAAGGPGCGGPA
jgi:hypothetical protein